MNTEDLREELGAIYKGIEHRVNKATLRIICGYSYEEEEEAYEVEFILHDADGEVDSIVLDKFDDETDAANYAEEIQDVAVTILNDGVEIEDEIEYVGE